MAAQLGCRMAKRTLIQWLWTGAADQDPQSGELLNVYTPPWRAAYAWISRHWRIHWKFWLNFLVAWAAVFVAILQWIDCNP